jgi:hypothetical protein
MGMPGNAGDAGGAGSAGGATWVYGYSACRVYTTYTYIHTYIPAPHVCFLLVPNTRRVSGKNLTQTNVRTEPGGGWHAASGPPAAAAAPAGATQLAACTPCLPARASCLRSSCPGSSCGCGGSLARHAAAAGRCSAGPVGARCRVTGAAAAAASLGACTGVVCHLGGGDRGGRPQLGSCLPACLPVCLPTSLRTLQLLGPISPDVGTPGGTTCWPVHDLRGPGAQPLHRHAVPPGRSALRCLGRPRSKRLLGPPRPARPLMVPQHAGVHAALLQRPAPRGRPGRVLRAAHGHARQLLRTVGPLGPRWLCGAAHTAAAKPPAAAAVPPPPPPVLHRYPRLVHLSRCADPRRLRRCRASRAVPRSRRCSCHSGPLLTPSVALFLRHCGPLLAP